MSRPIESGCRAVVDGTNGPSEGLVLTVLGEAGLEESSSFSPDQGKVWFVDKYVAHQTNTGRVGYDRFTSEVALKRLDDDEPGNWDDIKDIFTPKDLMVLGG